LPNHFTNIGFVMDRPEDLFPLAKQAVESGRSVDTPRGRYFVWAPGAGAEIWVGLNKSNEIMGVEPFFAGSGRMSFRLEALMSSPPVYEGLEGGLSGWADARPGEPTSGLCPLIIDLPDFDLQRDRLEMSSVLMLQVAAFANSPVESYPSDSAYYESQARHGPTKFASEFFIPSGLFVPRDQPNRPPRAYATFAGHVERATLLENPTSRRSFHHVLVKTAAGLLDVVADPTLMSRQPVVTGVVTGEFWLTGRTLAD